MPKILNPSKNLIGHQSGYGEDDFPEIRKICMYTLKGPTGYPGKLIRVTDLEDHNKTMRLKDLKKFLKPPAKG